MTDSRLLACVVLVALLTTAARGDGPDLAGRWKGTIDVPGTALEVDVDFARGDGGWTGDISIPAQMAQDLPLADIAVEDGAVRFRIAGVPGEPTFDGAWADDGAAIAGDFRQGGMAMPFRLEHVDDPGAAPRGRLGDFEEFVENVREQWEVPGVAMAIVVDDAPILVRGWGRRDLESDDPVTAKTLFAIGSCTKAFTAFLLATYVESGELSWDDRVVDRLPTFRLAETERTFEVTVRDLLCHRTGLPRHDLAWYGDDVSRDVLLERLAHQAANKPLRSTWQYNNFMFLVAGRLGGALSGTTWESALRERVLDPIGMGGAVLRVTAMQAAPDFARPHERRHDEIVPVPYRPIDAMAPAGAIDASVEQLVPWLRLHASGGRLGDRRLISAGVLREMHAPQMAIPAMPVDRDVSPMSYGLGWMVDTYRGHLRVHHGGAIDGFVAEITIFPRDGIGIATVANLGGTALPSVLTNHAADRLLELEPRDWHVEMLNQTAAARMLQERGEADRDRVRVEGTAPSHPLDAYAGDYDSPAYGRMTVAVEGAGDDAHLRIDFHGISTPFEHWHYDVFNGLESSDDPALKGLLVRFDTGWGGTVDALESRLEPTTEAIRFARAPESRLTDPAYLQRFAGRYAVGPQVVRIVLQGSRLVLHVPGQPPYPLVPRRDDRFVLEDLDGFGVRFETSDEGTLSAWFEQPNGVFEAKRVEGD